MNFPRVFLDERYVADLLVDPDGNNMGLSRCQDTELEDISDEDYEKLKAHMYSKVLTLGSNVPPEDFYVRSSDFSKYL